MRLTRRQLLALGGSAVASAVAGCGKLPEPDVTAAGFGEDASGTVRFWCRAATLPVALVNVQQGAYGTLDYGYLIAGAVISMIPCIVLYVSLQRFYVQGLASGAVKD